MFDHGVYPIDAPGMPPPGPDFESLARFYAGEQADAAELYDAVRDIYRRVLYERSDWLFRFKDSVDVDVSTIPGHRLGYGLDIADPSKYARAIFNMRPSVANGPAPARVMVIGKGVTTDDLKYGRQMMGDTGRVFMNALAESRATGWRNWYVTSLIKFPLPDVAGGKVESAWVADFLPILHQELRLVQPDYILCLGADVVKVLFGKSAKLGDFEGRATEFTYNIGRTSADDRTKTALVSVAMNPSAVVRAEDKRRVFTSAMTQFHKLTQGVRPGAVEEDIDHRAIRTYEELDELLTRLDGERTEWVAVDAEWHGEHPQNADAYLRTVQFSWKPKHAVSVIMRGQGGVGTIVDVNGEDAFERTVRRLDDWFGTKRIIGHFLCADLEVLLANGFSKILDAFKVPVEDKPFDELPAEQKAVFGRAFKSGELVPAWLLTTFEGGWDTAIAAHALEETAMLGLEELMMRYTTAPRYDLPLANWVTQHCAERKIKRKQLKGYGDCPDDILVPYGCYDADVTYRLFLAQWKLMDNDYEGNSSREGFYSGMLTVGPICEMRQHGILVDRGRVNELAIAFAEAAERLQQQIVELTKWPTLNLRSPGQVRELLFGERFNRIKPKKGQPRGVVRLRPPEAVSLNLTPLFDTSKRQKSWDKVIAAGHEDVATPATGKLVLGLLIREHPEIPLLGLLRDYRYIDQAIKGVLREPLPTDDDDGHDGDVAVAEDLDALAAPDTAAGLVRDAGLLSQVCDDDRVRTTLLPTAETGRWRSLRPNLQNMSKRRDPDYERILGKERYKYKMRSILRAKPGCLLIEADYQAAEVFVVAILSDDELLMSHCQRSALPDDHPDYFDVHSNTAVKAFGLECAPTKAGLKSIGKVSLRIAAKNVLFGIFYGRSAAAIAVQCREEGNPISEEDAQRIIDTILDTYSKLKAFFQECRERAADPRWLQESFGRLRRFPAAVDRKMLGEFERQAMNFPIQGYVAGAMNRALARLQAYRDRVLGRNYFDILLQMHDAGLFQVPIENAKEVCKLLKTYFCECVALYPRNLDGTPTGRGPYYFVTDVEVFEQWGQPSPIAASLGLGH